MNIPNPLIAHISSLRASLFLGAGASIEAGFPSGQALAEYLAHEAGGNNIELLAGQPLDVTSQFLFSQPGYGKAWVRDRIIRLFQNKHRQIKAPFSPTHASILKYRWRAIFTTNFDRLIEIAYDSTPEQSVQRILPFYEPDPQLFRFDETVARLIKLNGSVDEAERNANHDLVLTFSEQQTAASNHPEFYELLRQEAVNGPIVFVGFRFAQPGAGTAGSSPELEQLKRLLQQMGPSAQWHYSVAPYDESDPFTQVTLSILRAAQVVPINATGAQFFAELVARLDERPVPLVDRPEIEVPIFTQMLCIDPHDEDRDRRHFEILSNKLMTLPAPKVVDSLNGRATWASFVNGHLISRLCEDNFTKLIDDCLQTAPEIVYFTAPAGWGTTFFLRDFSIKRMMGLKPVIWLNPYGTLELTFTGRDRIVLGTWDAGRLDSLLGEIAAFCVQHSIAQEYTVPLIVADNCSQRAPEVLSLFRSLSRTNRKFVLVFSSREVERESLIQSYPLLNKAKKFSPSADKDSEEEVNRLIDFCEQNHVAVFSGAAQREEVARQIRADNADTALILALQIIYDKEHRPFSQIVQDMWDSLKNPDAMTLVLRVASAHRFGDNFTPRLYTILKTFRAADFTRILEIYYKCIELGVLHERFVEGEPCVSTLHSLVAQRLAVASGKSSAAVDEELLMVVAQMTDHQLDLELLRTHALRINNYSVLMTESSIVKFFEQAARATNRDWVICQQFAIYHLEHGNFDEALEWAEQAIHSNPGHPPLHHTRGNVLRKWGMSLQSQGQLESANQKFAEASECFARSRVVGEPDEYGYVTHLDMLIHLQKNSIDAAVKANYIAEGAALYREGLNNVPKDRFNLLLHKRFAENFQLKDSELDKLCHEIEAATTRGAASTESVCFVARVRNAQGDRTSAMKLLRQQMTAKGENLILLVTQAEMLAKNGGYDLAQKAIAAAKRHETDQVSIEHRHSLHYWNMLISMALGDFSEVKESIFRLRNMGVYRRDFPRGYFWKEDFRSITPQNRKFTQHAKVWDGRIREAKAIGSYGQVECINAIGETLYIEFNPKYFNRKDFRRGDPMRFVLAILPNGLRADDVSGSPFLNTVDDLFVR